MMLYPMMLWSDVILFMLMLISLCFIIRGYRHRHLQEVWQQMMRHSLAMIAVIVLMAYISIALLDSVHFQNGSTLETRSLLDILIEPLAQQDEKTYSAPFATHLFVKEMTVLPNGVESYDYPRLHIRETHVENSFMKELIPGMVYGGIVTVALWIMLWVLLVIKMTQRNHRKWCHNAKDVIRGNTVIPWRTILLTIGVVSFFAMTSIEWSKHYHILGTDKIGRDVFYEVIKSIRTDVLIAVISIGIMLPFALILGMAAGYFRGWVDDLVQYLYTTLNSIPEVLLIAAAVLALQVFIFNHPDYFSTIASRADIRLLALCFILGITNWTHLCRLLRGETLKLREMDYVQAAHVLGTSNTKIMLRHILPNLMHIVLIIAVIDFSSLILAEAVLSYLGIGVDPSMFSWGNMINAARLELSREPVVWWPLMSALVFMFVLVIAANLFADALNDALDPRH